jgi:hypothetical protein
VGGWLAGSSHAPACPVCHPAWQSPHPSSSPHPTDNCLFPLPPSCPQSSGSGCCGGSSSASEGAAGAGDQAAATAVMQQLSSLMGGMEGSLTREDMRSAFEAGPQVGPLAAGARACSAGSCLPATDFIGPSLAAGQPQNHMLSVAEPVLAPCPQPTPIDCCRPLAATASASSMWPPCCGVGPRVMRTTRTSWMR